VIYTVTPNPALDTCGIIDRLVPDEKNYVHEVVRFPGGNGANVARILTRLRVPCIATGFLGGTTGEQYLHALRHEHVRNEFVKIQGMTRLSITVTQTKTGRQTRLSFPGPKILPKEARTLETYLDQVTASDILMCGGSLPEGYPALKILKLVRLAKAQGAPVVLDCPGKVLAPLVKCRPTLIKPNLVEFQELIGKKLHSIDSVGTAARGLLPQVRLICVSSVDHGALLITRNGTWYGKGKRIKACSSVGAGDSMVAGMMFQFATLLSENWEDLAPEALRWGIAAGLATASNPTGYLGQASDIRHFVSQVKVKRLTGKCI
jgi:1-phosphofructokinase family hexose kinase